MKESYGCNSLVAASKPPPKKKYGVGIQENGAVIGYTYGPYCTQAEALDCLGEYHGVIVCFFTDGTEKIIYRWASQDNNWERI